MLNARRKISSGVFEGGKARNNEERVRQLSFASLGRSVGPTFHLFFERKVLLSTFFNKIKKLMLTARRKTLSQEQNARNKLPIRFIGLLVGPSV